MELERLLEMLNSRRGLWPKLAKVAGVNYSTIVRVANGRCSPKWETMEAIRLACREVKP